MNISEFSGPVGIKFNLKHYWGRGKAELGFGADRLRTLVSMRTDSSHRDIMGKNGVTTFLGHFTSDFLFNIYSIRAWRSLKLDQIPLRDMELAAL